MATGRDIENRGHITGFKEEISKAASSSDNDFFTWFDSARDKEAAFIKGSWDFMQHIAYPSLKFLTGQEDKVALEIGHGGGRLLAAASPYFKSVIGVDIHENNQLVEDELKMRGINNFQLIKTKGSDIPVNNASIDFVYSFIVLQHVETLNIFKEYLKEAGRVLKPGGIAVIYFGRKKMLSGKTSSRALYFIDKIAERFLLLKGFHELPAKVNVTNLIISLSYAKSLAKNNGLEILADLVSYKKGQNDKIIFGGQNGLLLRRI